MAVRKGRSSQPPQAQGDIPSPTKDASEQVNGSGSGGEALSGDQINAPDNPDDDYPFSPRNQRAAAARKKTMGAANSREFNQSLHNTAEQFKRHDEALAAGKNANGGASTSMGKLKRQSSGIDRNMVTRTGRQKPLAPANTLRKSDYDLNASPEKPRLRPKAAIEQPISPTRKQRKAKKPIPHSKQPDVSNARRSGTQQEQRRQDDENEGEYANPADAIDNGSFSPALIEQLEEGAATAGAEDHEDHEIIVREDNDAPGQVEAEAGTQGQTKQRRPPGRPKKSESTPKKSSRQTAKPTRSSPRKPKPIQRYSEEQSALEDLRRRRSGANGADAELDDENVEDAEAGPSGTPKKRGRPAAKPGRVRPESMGLGEVNGVDSSEANMEETERQQPQQVVGQKRTHAESSQSARANTGAKRRKQDAASNEEDQHRLFGQWTRLQLAFDNIAKVGRNTFEGELQPRNEVEKKDKDVKAVMKLCKDAKKRFGRLQNHTGPINPEQEPATVLSQISERIQGLCGHNEEYSTDFTNEQKVTEIYAHLLPELVTLVRDAALCYETMDKDETPGGDIKIGHLRILYSIVFLTLALEDAAKRRYVARPDSGLAVVKPVHDGIIVPLRELCKAFKQHINTHESSVRQRKQREEEAQHRAVQLEQEERMQRQESRIRKLSEKWKKLHEERRLAESGLIPPAKLKHLRLQDNPIEYDQDGMPFERSEVFVPRVGPTPGLVDEAKAREWKMDELLALQDGLERYTGPVVFERIFRRYCAKGQELNRFNVTEIVTTAASLRELLIQERRGMSEDVEPWVLAIPMWTKAQHALGKENEDDESFVDLTAEG